MKFWQRCLLLGSSFFLVGTVYYYIALDRSGVDRDLRLLHQVELGLEDTAFSSIFRHFIRQPDPQVCAMKPSHPSSNLSTLDLFFKADFSILPDGMYQMPTPPPDYPFADAQQQTMGTDDLEPLNVIIMPHSHTDPGWQKTTSEYYADHTKHILTNMVNKLTEHPDLTFVWAEAIYFSMWWEELDDTVKVHVRRLIRHGQLEVVGGGWVMADEGTTHYVSLIDQLLEGHQWLWHNLHAVPTNSWAIDPFGHSATMAYLWKLAGMNNMMIQRVHQAVKASLMSQHSLEFYWRQLWDDRGLSDILCHIMPYMLYSIKFSCGPNRFVCLLFDFRSIPGILSDSRAQAITPSNVQKYATYLYTQFRHKSYFYKYNTILVPVGDDFRYDRELEWDQQYNNYSLLMAYMNGRKDWKVKVSFGTLKDYFRLTREEQKSRRLSGKDSDFPVLSGDFFPYSDRKLDYWTGYYSTRPFDKRFQREVQGMIQAGDVAVTLMLALYRGWRQGVQEKFFQLSSMMQRAHRAQAQFLHHDAITGTARDFVVADFEAQLLSAYHSTQSVMGMILQALITRGKVDTPHVFRPETVRHVHTENARKERLTVPPDGLLLLVYNPLPQHRRQPLHVLVSTNLIYIKNHQRQILPCQINPVWEEEVIGVKADVYELVFVADLPPLATMPFMLFSANSLPGSTHPAHLSVFNSDTLVVPPHTLFPHQQPEAVRRQAILLENSKVRVTVDPSTGQLVDLEDQQTGNRTALYMGLEVYLSQGSGAYLFQPQKAGSQPLISNAPLVRMVKGPVVSQLTVVYAPYITQTFSLYHHPALMASALHVHNELNIQILKDREVIMRMKTDLCMKRAEFFSDQNGMQYIRRWTNDNTTVEANYYPVTSGAFLQDGQRRVMLLMAQPHGASSLDRGWLEVMLDRHVTRDDGRGMEEGVRDIKPAVSDFVLLVEAQSSDSRPTEGSSSEPQHAFPSLLSLVLGDQLQQPPQVFFSQVNSHVFFGTVQPLEVALPCDMALLSLRSLSTDNFMYNGTSLLLHRRAYDCHFPPPIPLPCSTGGQPLTFHTLFKGLGHGVQAVRQTSLTHLHQQHTLHPKSSIQLQPMQIAAYHIEF